MEPLVIPLIQSSSFVQEGICQATMEVGTNYGPLVHHRHVKTSFNLRFEGGHPVQVQPVYDAQQQTVGWELRVTGIDELQHLVMAFETAAAELRRQGGGVLTDGQTPLTPAEFAELTQFDPLLQSPPIPNQLTEEIAQYQRAEFNLLRLLVGYGLDELPDGQTVATYLLKDLVGTPFTTPAYAPLWALCQQAFQAGNLPTVAWLRQHGSTADNSLIAELEADKEHFGHGPGWVGRVGGPSPASQLKADCVSALGYLSQAQVRVRRVQLLAEMQNVDVSSGAGRQLLIQYNELTKLNTELSRQLSTAWA